MVNVRAWLKQTGVAIGLAMATTLVAGFPAAIADPTVTFSPRPGTRLSNFDAFLSITVDLGDDTWSSLPYNWQEPSVVLNGTDISLAAQSLLAGATAAVLTSDKIVVSAQEVTANRMVLNLSGLRLEPGFTRLVVELTSTSGGEPFKIDVSYPVIAGQGQSTSSAAPTTE